MTTTDVPTSAASSAPDSEVPSPISLSTERYPTGWFQVAWSDDLPVSQTKLLHYFGRDIVLWRGASGQVNATDTYCLHLGANLGVGGKVAGENIVCPWHRWEWDGEGRNTDIPYSAQGCKKHLRLETWPVTERNGGIWLWHDKAGGSPTWEVPIVHQFNSSDFFDVIPETRREFRVKTHPQLVIENGVDAAHIMPIHGAGEMPTIERVAAEGHIWKTTVSTSYGAGKKSTALTPDGALRLVLEWVIYGIGFGTSEWPGEFQSMIMLLSTTPVDDVYSDIRLCMTTKKPSADSSGTPTPGALKLMEHQMVTVPQDFFIWENMKVLHVPNFAPEEAKYYAGMRKWAWQFYPAAG